MIIISKFKDYYDWVISKYGRDPLIVLDRRKDFFKIREYENKNKISHYIIFINKVIYHLYFYKNKLYYTEKELVKLYKLEVHDDFDLDYYIFRNKVNRFHRKYDPPEEPLISAQNSAGEYGSIQLKEVDFHKIIPADEMYLKLYTLLSHQRESKIQDKMTDKEKIISHGMDLKKSFRHRK